MPKQKDKRYWLTFVLNVNVTAKSDDEAWQKVYDGIQIKDCTYEKMSNENTVGVYDLLTNEEIEE